MISELQTVVLNKDFPEHGLSSGQIGVVVHVFSRPDTAYEVEFCNPDGETIAMVTLHEEDMRPAA